MNEVETNQERLPMSVSASGFHMNTCTHIPYIHMWRHIYRLHSTPHHTIDTCKSIFKEVCNLCPNNSRLLPYEVRQSTERLHTCVSFCYVPGYYVLTRLYFAQLSRQRLEKLMCCGWMAGGRRESLNHRTSSKHQAKHSGVGRCQKEVSVQSLCKTWWQTQTGVLSSFWLTGGVEWQRMVERS